MNTSTIEKQIWNCRNLLTLFQEEREGYLQNNSISMKDVIDILRKKIKLISDLEELKRFVNESSREDEGLGESQDEKKKRIRELSDLLEQLLVIEHENELLLKEMMNNVSAPSKNVTAKALSSKRQPMSPKLTGIAATPIQLNSPIHSKTDTTNEKIAVRRNVELAKRRLITYA